MEKTRDYFFDLPEELIARFPPEERGDSRLLVMKGQELIDSHVKQLCDFLDPNTLMVFNNSRVRKSRFAVPLGHDDRYGEVLFLERLDDTHWEVIVSLDENYFETYGDIPLPPYLKRHSQSGDLERYQTIYAQETGSAAAPTAGLHFTEQLLGQLKNKGISMVHVTLHVGLGTFQPIRSEFLHDHRMHTEKYSVGPETAQQITEAKKSGKTILAVGTTSVRTLESAWIPESQSLMSGEGETGLFISPGYRFQVVDRMFTNFHTPESSLMVLVSAFAGFERIRRAYQHAINRKYRFFSYGDATLLDAQ